jgi:excisionase family DNA binding protein
LGTRVSCPTVGKPPATRGSDERDVSSLSEIKFLTVAEVAAVMRVSRMTVYRLVHAGDLASVRVGRSFRVPEHAVHSYLRGAFDVTA